MILTERMTLNAYGNLSVDRNGKMQKMYCPFQQEEERCGSWCPLFGDITKLENTSYPWRLEICKNEIVAKSFEHIPQEYD